MITAAVATIVLAASTATTASAPLAVPASASSSGSHQRFLPMKRARTRAKIAAREIARINPLNVKWTLRDCARRSRATVDCTVRFRVGSQSPCDLVIRVRYASRSSRRTVATYPRDPVCLASANAAAD